MTKKVLGAPKTTNRTKKSTTSLELNSSANPENLGDNPAILTSRPSDIIPQTVTQTNQIPSHWKLLFDEQAIDKSLSRIAFEILERDQDFKRLALVGIKTHGETIATRLAEKIHSIEKRKVKFGVIDITLYRDDIGHSNPYPVIKGSELDFEVSDARIVLIDDVLFTGRTIRSALDAIIDYGRPKRVELATLIDRGHRELPIRADYVGKNVPTRYRDRVVIRLKENGFKDAVYLIPEGEHK